MPEQGFPYHNESGKGGRAGADPPLLLVDRLSKAFGGVQALNDVRLRLEQGRITSMIGPNGAGKSTFINVVSGVYGPDRGDTYFRGHRITGRPAHEVAHLGVGRTFQLEELFRSLSVLENAMVGCHCSSFSGLFSSGFKLRSARAEEKEIRARAMENLRMIGLEERASDSVSSLPLGERKLLGIARVLGMAPKLLLLDEPVGGLAAHEIKRLVNVIDRLLEEGLTLFIVEHNMPFVMSLSEWVVVLDGGRKLLEGPPEEVRADKRVIKAYLGEEA